MAKEEKKIVQDISINTEMPDDLKADLGWSVAQCWRTSFVCARPWVQSLTH